MRKVLIAVAALVAASQFNPGVARAQQQRQICQFVGCGVGQTYCADVEELIWVEGLPIWVSTLCLKA